ncbi:hypothetical protein DFP72DRAFT_823076 [Ephemerocybe angulata]|uniref:Ubiquitin-like protease family profile domain-containing protein n=1 Tax=Ephemerocybe angulata TaxID=980116 RepID=A0A8H6HHW7_9AGAR|nr:hypothetical protein DFP72DRAFT_823076 [Tulosesus angulatus]
MRELYARALGMFPSLPWTGRILGVFATDTLDTLALFLSDDWLSDNHMHYILENYSREIFDSNPRSTIHLEGSFIKLLEKAQAAQRAHSGSVVETEDRWLRNLGEELSSGISDCLGFVINLDNTHWVACVLDFRAAEILYGDSFQQPIRRAHRDVLLWWTKLHCPELEGEFAVKPLPITFQTDSFSCGVLASNALASFCSGGRIPLLSGDGLTSMRLNTFLELATRHNDMVSSTSH